MSGVIDAPNPGTVVIEFFVNRNGDPSGYGEGEKFLGATTPNSLGEFQARLPKVRSGSFVTSTATDAAGNTSEFSAWIVVN